MIDTHAHIYLDAFDNDRNIVIKKAIEQGIEKILLPNIDSSTIADMMSLSEKYPDICFPMMGLHPTSVNENYQKELSIIHDWIQKNKFIAIGEIGIDLYWDKTFVEEQKIAFKNQIQLSIQEKLPSVIHIRNAFDETFSVLNEINLSKFNGVFHCFSGNITEAKKTIEMGFYLGIGGIVTYKNSDLNEIVKKIELDKIVLETDAPFLPPVPFRGKRNESSYLKHIAEKIAKIKSISVNEVDEITSNNAKKLFNI